MEGTHIENPISDTELIAQLEKELETLTNKRDKITDELLNNNPDLFDKKKLEVFNNTIGNISPEMLEIYFRSIGYDYDDLVDNHKKFKKFEAEQLDPVNEEISKTRKSLGQVYGRINEAERARKAQEEKEAFKSEKLALINKLYEQLDKIHAQIPQEAHDVGMTTKAAFETYAPRLGWKASEIERWINEVEETELPFHLKRVRESIDRDKVLE